VPSARALIHPESASAFRWRLTGRLGQLHDAAELGHGQLVPVEQQQDPAARRIRQRGEDGRGLQGPDYSSVKPDERIYQVAA
jgi:hypothetical protein